MADKVAAFLTGKHYIFSRYNLEYSGGKVKMGVNFGYSISIKDSEAQVTLQCILFRNAMKEESLFI